MVVTSGVPSPLGAAAYLRMRYVARLLRRWYGKAAVVASVGVLAVAQVTLGRLRSGRGAFPLAVVLLVGFALTVSTTNLRYPPMSVTVPEVQWLLLAPNGERALVVARQSIRVLVVVAETAASAVLLALSGGAPPVSVAVATGATVVAGDAFRMCWWALARHLGRPRRVRLGASAIGLGLIGSYAWLFGIPTLGGEAIAPTAAATTAALVLVAAALTVVAIAMARGYTPEAAEIARTRAQLGGAKAAYEAAGVTGARLSWLGGGQLQGDWAFLWAGLASLRRSSQPRQLLSAVLLLGVPATVLALVAPDLWFVVPAFALAGMILVPAPQAARMPVGRALRMCSRRLRLAMVAYTLAPTGRSVLVSAVPYLPVLVAHRNGQNLARTTMVLIAPAAIFGGSIRARCSLIEPAWRSNVTHLSVCATALILCGTSVWAFRGAPWHACTVGAIELLFISAVVLAQTRRPPNMRRG